MTPLDQAHSGLMSGDDGDARRFYRLLADAHLHILLAHEAEGEAITPRLFDLDQGPVILVFDTEDRLASLGDTPVPYATLPGRLIAQHLAGQRVSLGLNLGTGAASETLLPPEALEFLVELLDVAPKTTEALPTDFAAPNPPPALDEALRFCLGKAAGLAAGAVLAAVRYHGGARGHMLVIVDAAEPARPALARSVAEALSFAGLEAAALDVAFLDQSDPVLAEIARVGLIYALPEAPAAKEAPMPAPPGSDKAKPPRLR